MEIQGPRIVATALKGKRLVLACGFRDFNLGLMFLVCGEVEGKQPTLWGMSGRWGAASKDTLH